MNDREICERIINQGNCNGINCCLDNCPLNGYCAGYLDRVVDYARSWLDRNPEQAPCSYCKEEMSSPIRDNRRCSIGTVIHSLGCSYFSVKQYEKLVYIGIITHCPMCGRKLEVDG